ncbi:hypothetical protein HYV49_04310 [Candidatus Pacearchaeota archaeon]|nr:hypothetical protein [Candidatus Pacearchaeota archaeon]
MQQPPSLKQLRDYLESVEPYWEILADRYMMHTSFSRHQESGLPLDHYERTFLTIFVKYAIEKASQENKEFGIKNFFFPSNKNYYWVRDKLNRYFVYKERRQKSWKNPPGPLAQYETLIFIGQNKTPAIIESSLNRFPRLQRNNNQNLESKIKIIQEEIKKDAGYIIVVPEEHITSAEGTLSNYDYFVEKGGLVARLHTSRDGFIKELMEVLVDYNLKIK